MCRKWKGELTSGKGSHLASTNHCHSKEAEDPNVGVP